MQHAPPQQQQMHQQQQMQPQQQMHPQYYQQQQIQDTYIPNCKQNLNDNIQFVSNYARTHNYPNIPDIVNNFRNKYNTECKGSSIPQHTSYKS
jgi:hypoxanthine phosphoribosyltransferase